MKIMNSLNKYIFRIENGVALIATLFLAILFSPQVMAADVEVKQNVLPPKLDLNIVPARVDTDLRYGALIFSSAKQFTHKTNSIKGVPIYAGVDGTFVTHSLISSKEARVKIIDLEGNVHIYEPVDRETIVFKDYKPVLKGETIGFLSDDKLKVTKISAQGFVNDFISEEVVSDNYFYDPEGLIGAMNSNAQDTAICAWASRTVVPITIPSNQALPGNQTVPKNALIDQCERYNFRVGAPYRNVNHALSACCNAASRNADIPGPSVKLLHYFANNPPDPDDNEVLDMPPIDELSPYTPPPELGTGTGGYQSGGHTGAIASYPVVNTVGTEASTAIGSSDEIYCPEEVHQALADDQVNNLERVEETRKVTIQDQIDLLDGACFDMFQAQMMGPVANTFANGGGFFSGALGSLTGSLGLSIPPDVLAAGGDMLASEVNNAIQGQLCNKIEDFANSAFDDSMTMVNSMYAGAADNNPLVAQHVKGIMPAPPSQYIQTMDLKRFYDPSRVPALDQ